MGLKMVTLHLPREYIKTLDDLVAQGWYSSRSSAIRTAVRDLLRAETTWKCPVTERLMAEIERERT